jgi:serine/threonine protein kinase/Tol biopolymer transport system component
MGEVYRAADKRLGRHVALKVLRGKFSSDRWALARFEQEARAVSALNHPNIVTIYDIGQAGEEFFFAMELIEGKSLRAILESGPLPIRRLVKIAVPMAEGIARAHEAGIVHRDLKPENIMVTRDDQVKILDFGIAKLGPEAPLAGSSPTVRVLYPTEPGVIVGTVGYMSPEQARMEKTDHRSDQFSFGAMLYEMACGTRAFREETAVDTLAKIIHDEPAPLAQADSPVPTALRWIIERCMTKDPGGRYASTDDLTRELRMLRDHLPEVLGLDSRRSSSIPPGPASAASRILHWRLAVPAVVAIALAAAGVAWLASRPWSRGDVAREPPPAQFSQVTFQPGLESFPSLSPDGRTFVFVGAAAGNKHIFLQRLGGRNAVDLTSGSNADDDQPAFSPDGEQIVFRSERNGGGLFLMQATGEAVRRITDFGFNPSWSPDGKNVVFASSGVFDASVRETASELWVVNASTGAKRQLETGDAVEPSWSPHGDRIAYWGLPKGSSRRTIWTIAAGDSAGGAPPVPVTSDDAFNWDPVWAPDGRSLYFASDRSGSTSLWRVPIVERTGRVLGAARPMTPPALWSGQLSVSRDGRRILYTALVRRMAIERANLDVSGSLSIGVPDVVYEGPQGIESIGLSPDGKSIAFTSAQPSENLFVIGHDGSGLQQLTTDAYRHRGARWSPDGKWLSLHANNSGAYQIWMIHPDGSGSREVAHVAGGAVEARWAPDGLRLLLLSPADTCIVAASGSAEPRPLEKVNAAGDTFFANDWSPNGKLLAGEVWRSNGSAIPGIQTYSFDSREYRKLTDGGSNPVWLADNRRILFLQGDRLFRLDTGNGQVQAVRSRPDLRIAGSFAVTRDDKQIYLVQDATQGDIWQMTIP